MAFQFQFPAGSFQKTAFPVSIPSRQFQKTAFPVSIPSRQFQKRGNEGPKIGVSARALGHLSPKKGQNGSFCPVSSHVPTKKNVIRQLRFPACAIPSRQFQKTAFSVSIPTGRCRGLRVLLPTEDGFPISIPSWQFPKTAFPVSIPSRQFQKTAFSSFNSQPAVSKNGFSSFNSQPAVSKKGQ